MSEHPSTPKTRSLGRRTMPSSIDVGSSRLPSFQKVRKRRYGRRSPSDSRGFEEDLRIQEEREAEQARKAEGEKSVVEYRIKYSISLI